MTITRDVCDDPRVGVTETVCEAGDVVAALERRFNPQGRPRQYATFTEVPDKREKRRIDLLAVNMWLSRGRDVQGIEVKVRRTDWVKELQQPKADEWFSICDRWWLAAPQGIVRADELPKAWGFLEMRRNGDSWRLFEKVKAPALEPIDDWPSWLVQRLLRRIDERRQMLPAELIAERERAAEMSNQAFERGRQSAVDHARYDGEARRELDALVYALGGGEAEFRWRDNEVRVVQIKRAIQLLDSGRLDNIARRTAQMFRETADSIESALAGSQTDDDGIEF